MLKAESDKSILKIAVSWMDGIFFSPENGTLQSQIFQPWQKACKTFN